LRPMSRTKPVTICMYGPREILRGWHSNPILGESAKGSATRSEDIPSKVYDKGLQQVRAPVTLHKQSIGSRGFELRMEGHPPDRVLAMQRNHTAPQERRFALNLFDWGKRRNINEGQIRKSVCTKLIENLLFIRRIIITCDRMNRTKLWKITRIRLYTGWRATRRLRRTAEPRS